MVYVGVDVGKKEHCVGAINAQGDVVLKPFKFAQERGAFEKLDSRLEELRQEGGDVKIGLEASGHYGRVLWEFLLGKGWDTQAINPVLTAGSSRTNLRGRKTDKDEALVIAKVIRDGGFKPQSIQDKPFEELKILCRQRRFIVCEASNSKRRLTGLVDIVFPEFASFFSDPHGRGALAVLKEAGSANKIAAMHLKSLESILSKNSNNRYGKEKAKALRSAARNSVAQTMEYEAIELSIGVMIEQLEFFEKQKTALDEKISQVYASLNHSIKDIDGIGDVTGPIILAELGDIARFSGPKMAKKVLAYAGADPRIRESGQWRGKVKMTKRGSPTLRTALYQAASMARLHNPGFARIYEKQIEKGKHHGVAISHVMRRLVEVVCATWKNGNQFDPLKV